ncbi:MAG: hypothetical protein FD123_781 [Bacteroidetes bacterium]|nr:MAG: hypothetical protein FD123_781 [Bacteroidota bacterium]
MSRELSACVPVFSWGVAGADTCIYWYWSTPCQHAEARVLSTGLFCFINGDNQFVEQGIILLLKLHE